MFNDKLKSIINNTIDELNFVERRCVENHYVSVRLVLEGLWVDVYVEEERQKTFDTDDGATMIENTLVPSVNWPACGNTSHEGTLAFSRLISEALKACELFSSRLPMSVTELVYTREENEKRRADKLYRENERQVYAYVHQNKLIRNMRAGATRWFNDVNVPDGTYELKTYDKTFSILIENHVLQITRVQ